MFAVDTRALRVAMAERGIYQIRQLEEATGVNRNTLSGVLQGTVRPSSIVITKIVDSLGLSPEMVGRIFFTRKLT